MTDNKPTMTLAEYWDMLDKADWHYDFSDDGTVWERGREEFNMLSSLASKHGEEFRQLLDGFKDHHFSGKPWGNEKRPKPERPEG